MAKPQPIEVPEDAAVSHPDEYQRILRLLREPDAVLTTSELAIWLRKPRLFIVNRLIKHPHFPRPMPHTEAKGAQALYLVRDLQEWARRGNV